MGGIRGRRSGGRPPCDNEDRLHHVALSKAERDVRAERDQLARCRGRTGRGLPAAERAAIGRAPPRRAVDATGEVLFVPLARDRRRAAPLPASVPAAVLVRVDRGAPQDLWQRELLLGGDRDPAEVGSVRVRDAGEWCHSRARSFRHAPGSRSAGRAPPHRYSVQLHGARVGSARRSPHAGYQGGRVGVRGDRVQVQPRSDGRIVRRAHEREDPRDPLRGGP